MSPYPIFMNQPDLNAAISEIRGALAASVTDARKILVVTGGEASNKVPAFESAATEAGLAVQTVSFADPALTNEVLNDILNKPSSNPDITYLLLDGLDTASDEALQEIEDALRGRSYLSTSELWRLPRLAATAAQTLHWLPESLRTEVSMPVPLPTKELAVEASSMRI